MKTTAAVLRNLQDYYASLEIRPGIKEVAQATSMPVATAARYLNGTNQTGDLERVRALCLALERHDLLDELPSKQSISSFQEAMALILEVKKESRESNLEELNRVRELHAAAEKRWERIVEGKDKHIDALTKRVERLETDKETQSVINTELNTEMKVVRNAKRKREAGLIISLVVNILLLMTVVAYLVYFDVPNPGYGLFR